MDDVQLSMPTLKDVDWSNDNLFFTHTWEDETSQFDPHPSKRFCGDYYIREYKGRIPIAFKDCEKLCDDFIEMMLDKYPGEPGFWVN